MSHDLQQYVRDMRRRGYSDADIQAALQKAGWQEHHTQNILANGAVISINNLKKYFGTTKAVDGVSLSVQKGEIFGFLGPNGAGKTTTIRCMMDFLRPTEGSIAILGRDSRDDAVSLKHNIGYLSGNLRLYEKWSGNEHINFLRKLYGPRADTAGRLMERLHFNPTIQAKRLSSGNRQKLGIIMAFMFQPDILILDEPTLALDPLLQNTVYALLAEAQARGTTVFMSSHNLVEVERVCTRVGIIREGRMVATESIESLKAKRVYTVRVQFSAPVDKNEFVGEDVDIVERWEQGFAFKVTGDMNMLLKKISRHPVRDLTITHASLEEIFLEFYRG